MNLHVTINNEPKEFICRCTGYVKPNAAILTAAAETRNAKEGATA
jgi:aerobic-type carbon monoxide dehydrogenase small subunit (CoxS/CutS family)